MGNDEEMAIAALRKAASIALDNGITMARATNIFERELLWESLRRAGNNQHLLADREGVHRNTISRHMKKLGVFEYSEPVRRNRRRSFK